MSHTQVSLKLGILDKISPAGENSRMPRIVWIPWINFKKNNVTPATSPMGIFPQMPNIQIRYSTSITD